MTPDQLAAAIVREGSVSAQAESGALTMATTAAVEFVSSLPVVADRADPSAAWPAAAEAGAFLLALRLYRRKDTPTGTMMMGDMGVAYVARYDADIARLLRLEAPAVG